MHNVSHFESHANSYLVSCSLWKQRSSFLLSRFPEFVHTHNTLFDSHRGEISSHFIPHYYTFLGSIRLTSLKVGALEIFHFYSHKDLIQKCKKYQRIRNDMVWNEVRWKTFANNPQTCWLLQLFISLLVKISFQSAVVFFSGLSMRLMERWTVLRASSDEDEVGGKTQLVWGGSGWYLLLLLHYYFYCSTMASSRKASSLLVTFFSMRKCPDVRVLMMLKVFISPLACLFLFLAADWSLSYYL